jgi:CrcB protein
MRNREERETMNGTWKMVASVALGGAVGSLSRYAISVFIVSPWPLATLLVNIVGSFILGMLTGYTLKKRIPDWLKATIGTGFCGGLTTMSTFSKEVVQLFTYGHMLQSIIYMTISLVGGLLVCGLGLIIGMGQIARKEEAVS